MSTTPKIQTRSQRNLTLAEKLVSQVEKLEDVRGIYGGLCHSFPVMVRTCGLCQALAFSTAKAAKDTPRATAHRLLLEHAAKVLSVEDAMRAVMDEKTDAMEYMLQTRRLLEAWIYFKRFAVSILGVENSEMRMEDDPDAR